MKIIIHTSDDPDTPENLRAIAHFLHNGDFLPVRVTAPTGERAQAKAQEFWDAEKAKLLKRATVPPKKLAPPQLSKSPASTFDPAPAITDDLEDLLG
jgi:hypothetical protein